MALRGASNANAMLLPLLPTWLSPACRRHGLAPVDGASIAHHHAPLNKLWTLNRKSDRTRGERNGAMRIPPQPIAGWENDQEAKGLELVGDMMGTTVPLWSFHDHFVRLP